MGWVSFPMRQKAKDWFKQDIELNGRYEVLDTAIVKRNTLFAAVKDLNTEQVFACIYLLRWSPKSDYNFSYKAMDETVGPYNYDCPKRIMDLLTPTDNDFANQWREKVRMYHKMNDILKKPNTTIKLNKPVEFTNGLKFSYFKKEGRKIFAGEVQKNSVFCKFGQVSFNIISHMRNHGYEFIEA